ncbi:hypothetical protein VoSk93_05680 [Vibrio owensii]
MNNRAPVQTNNMPAIQEMLTNRLTEVGIEALLPKHITVDRFVQVAAIACMKNPRLKEATQDSLIMAFADCARDGLIPDNREAFINTFKKNLGSRQSPNYQVVAEYQPMIQGVIKRARLSGEVSFICADVVFPEDRFEYYVDEEGTHLLHVPDFEADRSVDRIKLFFAMARLKSGEVKAAVMTRKDVDRVRAASTGKNSDAWRQWYDRMGLKSVGHRLCRDLPRGDELLAMLEKNNEMSWNEQAWQEQQWNGEIDVTPSYEEAVKHGHAPVNVEIVEVEELMGAEPYTFEQEDNPPQEYEQPQYHEPDIDQLMSAEPQQVNEVYAQLESAVLEIGDTDDRQRTIERYKYAVGAVNNAVRVNAISEQQANLLSQQLTTIYQAINSEL